MDAFKGSLVSSFPRWLMVVTGAGILGAMFVGYPVCQQQQSVPAPKATARSMIGRPSRVQEEAAPAQPFPLTEAPDDGGIDLLSGRTAAFEVWQEHNADLWADMDQTLQDCVYMRYVNAFGSSPEDGLDECLDYFEDQDQ